MDIQISFPIQAAKTFSSEFLAKPHFQNSLQFGTQFFPINDNAVSVNIKLLFSDAEMKYFISDFSSKGLFEVIPNAIFNLLTDLIVYLHENAIERTSFTMPENHVYEEDGETWTVENNWKTFDFVAWWIDHQATIHKLQQGMNPHQVLLTAK